MGPLELVTDWAAFDRQLLALKRAGVDGITTDIWWGIVEPKKGQFDWSYYLKYAHHVKGAGLKWTPILSFHQAGGNVGDTVDIPLPPWIWSELNDAKFVGSDGFVSDEYIALWADEAYPLYQKVMVSFAQHFIEYGSTIIEKIYVSLGPCGELRYPSYVPRAGWNYPGIGTLQAYSARAKNGFRDYLRENYSNQIQDLNLAWQTSLGSFDDVQPPMDGENFFARGVNTPYGRDFLNWYQGSLELHAFRMLSMARAIFRSNRDMDAPIGDGDLIHNSAFQDRIKRALGGQQYRLNQLRPQARSTDPGDHLDRSHARLTELLKSVSNIPIAESSRGGLIVRDFNSDRLFWALKWAQVQKMYANYKTNFFGQHPSAIGAKLAGIHWQRQNPSVPHAAELAAGYVDYTGVVGVFSALAVQMTFTCLEMADLDVGYPAYSTPQALVRNVARLTQLMGVALFGENALAINGSVNPYLNIRAIFEDTDVQGFTLLRLEDLVTPDGRATAMMNSYSDILLDRKRVRFDFELDIPQEHLEAGFVPVFYGLSFGLGDGSPRKGVPLTRLSPTQWTTEVELNRPGRIQGWVALLHPSTGVAILATDAYGFSDYVGDEGEPLYHNSASFKFPKKGQFDCRDFYSNDSDRRRTFTSSSSQALGIH